MKRYLTEKQEYVLRLAGTTGVIYLIFRYLLPLLLPFVVALLLSLLIRPAVRWLYRRFHIPMGIGAGIVLAGILVMIGIMVFWLGRAAAVQLIRLGQQLPDIWKQVSLWLQDSCGQIEETLKLREGMISLRVTRWMDHFVPLGGGGESVLEVDQMWGLIETSLQGAADFLRIMFSLLVTTFVTIGATLITTVQLETLRRSLDRSLFGKEIRRVGCVLTQVSVAYGKTQLVIMVCTVVLSAVGLTILGDPYALLWSAAIGLVDALPIFGAGTILWPWILLAVLRGQWRRAVGLAIIYGITNLTRQWLEARYMGDRIGISALENLIAMYLGLKLFGILGLFWGPIGYLLIRESGEWMEDGKEKKDRG